MVHYNEMVVIDISKLLFLLVCWALFFSIYSFYINIYHDFEVNIVPSSFLPLKFDILWRCCRGNFIRCAQPSGQAAAAVRVRGYTAVQIGCEL